MSEGLAITLALVLLAGNAFFVGAEFALISARRTQIEPRAAAGSRAAMVTLRALEEVSLMMAGAQLGITICSLGLGALGEPAVAHLIEGPLSALGLPDRVLHPVAFAMALAIVVFLHMVLGEMVPKNIAIAGPERAALILGPALYRFVRLLRPMIVLLNAIANAVLRVVRVEPQNEVSSTFTRAEVAGLVEESREEGLLAETEFGRLSNALHFAGDTVSSVVIPIDRLVTLPEGATALDLQRACAETGFSRFPVRRGLGLVGYVHVKDALPPEGRASESPPNVPLQVRSLASLPSRTSLADTLAELRRRRAHLSAVHDHGSHRVVGVVMLEDVLEQLVGEVQDERPRA